jgi:small-conductance mechanosensitive channel
MTPMRACRTCLWRRRAAVMPALLFLCLALVWPAHAAPPAAPAQIVPPSTAEIESVLRTLQNDRARARLVAELRALLAAQHAAPARAPHAIFDRGSPRGQCPHGVPPVGTSPRQTADPWSRLSQRLDALSGEILAGAAIVVDAPQLLSWARRQIANPALSRLWITDIEAFLLVFGIAAALEWALRATIARLLPGLPVRSGDGPAVRAGFALLGFVLDLLPILGFAAAASAVLSATLAPYSEGRAMLAALIDATVEFRLVLAVARALLPPRGGAACFLPLDEERRNYLYIWTKRFAGWAVYGYAVPAAAWWLGVPGALYALLLKTAALVLAILAVVFVLQNRAAVAGWIAGPADPGPPLSAEPGAGPSAAGWRRMRKSLGEIWHVLVIFYIAGIFAIYALHIDGGFSYVLRATVLSLLVILAARLSVRLVRRIGRHSLTVAPDLRVRFPTLEQRANRYSPLLTGLAAVLVYLFATLAVLAAWDVPSFAWFGTSLGRRVTAGALSVGAVVVAAVAAWEVFSAAIERHIRAMDGGGAARRTRLRTLLPFLRSAMLGAIVVMAALIVLSQIGIDIAPLLAGAGVVGLAIGFGSQALVKDVITGLFILVEDQVAVGDVVDLGHDHVGAVEAITVRTIRLRDQAGIVHMVPFSNVTTVKNLSRDFAYYVARITISYSENIDRVVAILREVGDAMMVDEALRPLILDPFDYQGVDALGDSSVVLLVRIRTLPAQQWKVGRAFNRLVKLAFEKHGVAARDPSAILVTGIASAAAKADDGAPALGALPP